MEGSLIVHAYLITALNDPHSLCRSMVPISVIGEESTL